MAWDQSTAALLNYKTQSTLLTCTVRSSPLSLMILSKNLLFGAVTNLLFGAVTANSAQAGEPDVSLLSNNLPAARADAGADPYV